MTTSASTCNLDELAVRAANWPLECDGTTRCLASLMIRHNQAFSVVGGQVDVDGVGYIAPHWWLELPDGRIFDVKARLWLDGDERAPHGVFAPSEGFSYRRQSVEDAESWAMSDTLFNILTGEDISTYDALFGR